MHYKPKSIPALHIALGGLSAKMRVEADPDTGVSAKTVGELRRVTSWPSPSSFVGLSTTPMRRRGGAVASGSSRRNVWRAGRALDVPPPRRADSTSQSPAPTSTTARAIPAQTHHPSDTEWNVQHAGSRSAPA